MKKKLKQNEQKNTRLNKLYKVTFFWKKKVSSMETPSILTQSFDSIPINLDVQILERFESG